MPQSLSHVLLHVVFSTKNRTPWLRDLEVRKGAHAYLAGACKTQGCHAKLINGVDDHVHILCELSRTVTIAGLLEAVKIESSKWVKTQGAAWRDFFWQRGYSVFSVSESNADTVRRYIADQDRHHKRMSFQDELRKLCKKHNVELDERYAWD
jgi:putative transposase